MYEPIAIIGYGVLYPPNSDNVQNFWKNIKNGVQGIREVTNEVWNVNDYYNEDENVPDKTYCKNSAYLDNTGSLMDYISKFNLDDGKILSLTIKERRVLIACGAGAGLAAVYQVPFASSLFVFETLGLGYSWQNILLVLASTYLANWIVQPIVGHAVLYHLPPVSWSFNSFFHAILIALLVTPLALVFSYLTKRASHKRRKDETILWALPLAFLVLASLAFFFPVFMGNGQVLAQALLSNQPIPYLPLTLAVKGLLVYLFLRNGAYGGTLTPSFALGVGAGYLVTLIFAAVGIHLNPTLGMLLGATVFLGTTLQAPLTAIALSIGFTGQPWSLTIPLVLAAGVSYMIRKRWEKKR